MTHLLALLTDVPRACYASMMAADEWERQLRRAERWQEWGRLLSEMGRGARALIGGLIGFFGAGFIVFFWYNSLAVHPCELLPAAQCHVYDGQDYATFDEFFSNQSVSVMYFLGIAAGAIGGFVSG